MPFLQKQLSHHYADEKGRFKRAWKESHGNLLLVFAAVIVSVGMLLIWTSPPRDSERGMNQDLLDNTEQQSDLPPNVILIRVVTSQPASEGPIRIAIYDSEDAFDNPEKAFIKDSLVPIEGFVVWEIKLNFLPERFAIAAYHDLDDNGELNRALFNAPVEPYGFSNNARSLTGPPTFEQTIIQRPTSAAAIEIRVY